MKNKYHIAEENKVRKGEIACYKQFLLFSLCFPQLYNFSASKCGIVWQWVKEGLFNNIVEVLTLAYMQSLLQLISLPNHKIVDWYNFICRQQNLCY